MGTFDSMLEQFGDSAADLFGGDAGDLLDNVQHAFSGSGEDGGDGDGGSSGSGWTDALGGLFGGSDDDGDGSGGGWSRAFGGLVDRLSGEGGEDGLFASAVDKAKSFLPEDLRDEAESLFRGGEGGSSWAGSLLDSATNALPDSWRSVASAAVGHSFGEGGFDALLGHSIDALGGSGADATPGAMADPATTARAAEHDDFDDLVTSGTSQPGATDEDADGIAPDTAFGAGDDPTFIADPTFPDDAAPDPLGSGDDGFAATDPAPPMDDFQQDIHAADQIDDSFDTMFEGLE